MERYTYIGNGKGRLKHGCYLCNMDKNPIFIIHTSSGNEYYIVKRYFDKLFKQIDKHRLEIIDELLLNQ